MEESLSIALGGNVSLFSNGTLALMIALRALDITDGEVITTPFTFPATPHSITWSGAKPIFCDVNSDTMCIDATKIEALITKDTKAILATHIYGIACDIEKIQQIADKHHLKVIYDAAHAFMTTYKGKPIASYGDISMFSFHATKIFHTIEGGCLVYNNTDLKEARHLLRNFGIQDEENVVLSGINAKMNKIQASIGLINLENIDNIIAHRKDMYNCYTRHLKGIYALTVPHGTGGENNMHQYFIVRISKEAQISRDELYLLLKEYNILTRKYFYPLCTNYKHYNTIRWNVPKAKIVSQEVLALPFYHNLALQDITKICSIMKFLMQ
ncbi:MAG: dTDP-4-amino-4,6-dideoxygalactose transaminase [Candidatus Deianiraeaceae bacterium]